MKKPVSQVFYLLLALIICQASHAQSRVKKNYLSDDGIQNHQSQKNVTPTFLQSALSGYYFEGFENAFPPAGWQAVDVLDTTYVWTSSDYADFPRAYEGAKSAYCHYTFPAGTPGEDWLITPKFIVSATDSLFFQFKLEYFGFAPDSTFILISTTDSALSSFNTVLDFYAEGLNYPADSSNWYQKKYALSAYAGQNIYVAFKYKNTFGDGVFIDNVELGTRPAAEVGVVGIDMDGYYPSGTSNPKASVKNYGGTTQTFNFTMNITGGYTSTKSVTVSPQSTSQITFDPWNPTVGTYVVNVQTFLVGDANPANDTLSSTIKVLDTFLNYGWSTHDPLPTTILGGAAVSVCSNTNSRYFVIGGLNGNFLTDGYEYDLAFGTWSGISPTPFESGYAGSAHANGKIFVFSGGNLPNGDPNGATQIYDYNTDTWTLGTPMPIPSANFATGIYKDSLVYIIGGNIGNAVASNSVQIYNTYTDSWTSGTAKPGQAVYAIRGGVVQNKIVVAGGYNPVTGLAIGTTYVGEIDALNPTQIAWTQVADHPTGKISRSGAGVSLDNNSSLIVFTGGTNSNTPSTATARTFAFDVNSNTWKLGPDKPTALNLFYMTPVLQNDSMYLAALGGGDGVNSTDKNEWVNLGYYQIPTGIAESIVENDFKLFPNPSSDLTMLSLNLKNASQVKITLIDVIGNAVMTVCDRRMDAGKNTIPIQTKHLSGGMYCCVMNVDSKQVTKKLFKR
jgi:hypothetical protein